MPKSKYIAGQTFGRLTLVEQKDFGARAKWLCRCSCSRETTVLIYSLISGNTKSCGCLKLQPGNVRHGHAKKDKISAVYQIWCSIIQRCTNPKCAGWKNYGGRGISICERWKRFDNFIADMGERPSTKHSIDRIDNDGSYEPSNCRWATRKEQSRNKRGVRMLTANGTTQCVRDWAATLGVSDHKVRFRIKNGLPLDYSGSTRKIARRSCAWVATSGWFR